MGLSKEEKNQIKIKEAKNQKRIKKAAKQRKKNGIQKMSKDDLDAIKKKYLDKIIGSKPNPLGRTSHNVYDGCVWSN